MLFKIAFQSYNSLLNDNIKKVHYSKLTIYLPNLGVVEAPNIFDGLLLFSVAKLSETIGDLTM